MRPTRLDVQGLKRWEHYSLELGQLTAIQGPNGSGKTALIQAVRLALLGYDPETGKQLAETRTLLHPSAEYAEIGLAFDSGFGIVRKFGKKTETMVVPPRGETTGRACQQRIDEETGGLVVTLNLGVFLELSDEKRRAWLFEHLPQDEAVLTWEIFAEWTDAEESALADVVQGLWDQNVKTAPNPVVGLGSAIEVAHRQFLEAERERQAQGTVVARGEERLRLLKEPETVAPGALEELLRRRDTVNQRIGQGRSGREARETLEKRQGETLEAVGRARRERDHHKTVREQLLEQLGDHPEPPDTLQLEAQAGALEEQVARTHEAHQKTVAPLHEAADAHARVMGRRDAVKRYEGEGCPFAALGCETDTSELVQGRLAGIEEELAAAAARKDSASELEAATRAARQEAVDELSRVNAEIAAARKVADDRTQLERTIGHEAAVISELEERVGIYEEQLDTIGAELGALVDDGLDELYRERDELEASVATLQEQLEAVKVHAAKLEAHKVEEAELERLALRRGELQELDGNLRRLRAFVIRTMITPLWREANVILQAIDPSKRFVVHFERENRAIMDFGFEEGEDLRFYNAASKGERVMLAVAFVGALLKVLEPPMRLLVIDDIEQLDDDRRRALLQGLVKLRDRFDSIIVAGACHFYPGLPPEWEFVDLQEEEAAVA